MKYYRNKTNTMVGLYDINKTMGPGAVVALTEKQVADSSQLQHFISINYVEEVEKDAEGINFKVSKGPFVVLPDGVQPEQREMAVLPDVKALEGIPSGDNGSIIIEGELPGTAEVQAMNTFIQNSAAKISDGMATAADGINKDREASKPTVTKPVPPEFEWWMALRLSDKKFKILQTMDMDWIKKIAEVDIDEKVQKLLKQRLAELIEANKI